METHLADWLKDTPDGIEADAILRACVHCGFCTATCPTTRRWLFDPAMRLGKLVRPLLPDALKGKVPASVDPGPWPPESHLAKVLLLNSCTQSAMMPAIDRATARVLDRLGVQAIIEPSSGCCGALRYHLNDHEGGKADARRNVLGPAR